MTTLAGRPATALLVVDVQNAAVDGSYQRDAVVTNIGSPGVWEVRVVVGFDPARGRSIQRSFTVHGDAALAGRARRELVAEYGSARSHVRCTAAVVTVGELLQGYLGSAQLTASSTAWTRGTANRGSSCSAACPAVPRELDSGCYGA